MQEAAGHAGGVWLCGSLCGSRCGMRKQETSAIQTIDKNKPANADALPVPLIVPA